MLRASILVLFGFSVAAAACSVYDLSLLGTGGAGGMGGSTSTSSSGSGGATGGGGASSSSSGGTCTKPGDCGKDTECQQHTCDMGMCGVKNVAMNTPLKTQTPKDCLKAVCDGMGMTANVPDDSDTPDDMKECTTDSCNMGAPVFKAKSVGTACGPNMTHKCDAKGDCVECIKGADCMSGICAPNNTCAPASCGDGKMNGNETDVDCGGACPPCDLNKGCMQPSDCKSQACTNNKCAPSCTDGLLDNNESDVDCGGPNCAPCSIGAMCNAPTDCAQGNCAGGFCVCDGTHLLISEIRTRGTGGAGDEFVELYNPTSADVMLDTTWKIDARGSGAGSYTDRWISAGVTIKSHGHFLIAGSSYSNAVAFDAKLQTGISDAASVRLIQGGTTIDAVCFAYNANTKGLVSAFTCEGTPADNSPHNDTTAGMSNSDSSLERLPGGMLGNCVDANDNSKDFHAISPANPQNSSSPITP